MNLPCDERMTLRSLRLATVSAVAMCFINPAEVIPPGGGECAMRGAALGFKAPGRFHYARTVSGLLQAKRDFSDDAGTKLCWTN